MLRYGFRQKIMMYLTITVLIQVIWIGFIFTMDVSDYTTHYKKEVIQTNLSAQVSLLNDWLDIQKSIIENYGVMLSRVAANEGDEKAIKDVVDVFEQQEDSFINVYYTGETGLNVVSGGEQPRVDGRERQWYKGAKVRAFYISQPYVDAITNQYVVTLSVAVNDPNGQFAGVLGADVLLSDLFNRIQLAEDDLIAAVIITDLSEKVLYYQSFAPGDTPYAQDQDFAQTYKTLNNTHEYIRVSVADMKADIRVYLKNDRYLTELINYNYDFWIAIVAGFIGIIIVLRYLSKVLAAPIRTLSHSIRNLTDQLDDTNISQENMDSDLKEIVNLFRKLDKHIKDNIKQINQMNENMKEANLILENKNEEFRTSLSDLYLANMSLKQSEKIYQNLINNIDEMIWIVDLEGRVVYANEQFYQWLGHYDIEEKPIYLRHFIKDIQKSPDFNGTSFFAKRDFNDLDLSLSADSGRKPMDLVVNTNVIYFKNVPVSIQFIGRDVTEEKKLHHQYYHKNREMMILNDISRSLTMKEDLKSILQLITDRISNLLSVSGVSVRMLQSGSELEMAAFSGQALNKIYPENPKLGTSHMGLALAEERIVSIQGREDLIFEDPYLESVLESAAAIYYFPLYNRENRFGVLTVIAEKPLEQDKIRLLKSLSENASTAIEKATLFERLRNNYLMTIEALSNALEEKVFNYKNHTKRVAEFSKLIAERFYLSQKDLGDIYISGLLHDIGKLGISDDILNHEELLSEEEETLMMSHVEIGRRIIEPIGLNKQIVEGIYLHHKNFDLSGYPETVDLERLPLFARIIGVADAFDSELIEARTSEDWRLELVFNQLEMHKETLYCPEVLAALWELIQENREQVIQISEI